MTGKRAKESLVINTDQVMINDLNNYNTLFGGVLMKKLDNNATLSARRHARVKECVTASTDSIDFLHPIHQTDSVCVESFVSYTGNKSMEIFCKVIAEDMITGERRMAATAFLTFVALDEHKQAVKVPKVIPETEEEKFLYQSGEERAKRRRFRRDHSAELTRIIGLEKPWEKGVDEHDQISKLG
ncbi:acyl-CoA thioesterase [Halobacillus kuroshimensis]|uniref:Acyl-CoA thioesterase n=1 Tax=Halobacillus kuroshimensis TaxID=302481 RepID=A0ABS3DV42_9BACI|nr:acyl-CoA thioesterase [Halobacillus kuroshimensis]MBN8235191.1 acyl-CoA thioesterase [Halobacillus kuroshimensis]